jgi:hypothetical protein
VRLQIKVASRLSGVATASMGKFDKQLRGEKPGERSLPGKRRKYMAVTDTKTEHNKVSEAACQCQVCSMPPLHTCLFCLPLLCAVRASSTQHCVFLAAGI